MRNLILQITYKIAMEYENLEMSQKFEKLYDSVLTSVPK